MIEKTVILKNEAGIHARPAGQIVKEAMKYKSSITIIKSAREYNAKSIMSVMAVAANCGEEVTIRVDGRDENAALEAIISLIKNNLE